ncbi:MAG: rubrerythrin family protein [Thermodesulfovibrionales bacterium]
MAKTQENLQAAFAGESQANRKYLAFAEKADKEGYGHAARLFRAAAEAETIHAHSHLRALGGIKSTKENLEAAVGGETYEYKEMYPPMIDDAKAEGDKKAELSFTYANAAEKIHAGLFRKALESLGKGGPEPDVYVCKVCGHIAEGAPPDQCPICKAKKEMFKKID